MKKVMLGLVAFVPAAATLLRATPVAGLAGSCPPSQSLSSCPTPNYSIPGSGWTMCCDGWIWSCLEYSEYPNSNPGYACGEYCYNTQNAC